MSAIHGQRQLSQRTGDILDKSASLLLEKEKISREEFEALFEEENKENEVVQSVE